MLQQQEENVIITIQQPEVSVSNMLTAPLHQTIEPIAQTTNSYKGMVPVTNNSMDRTMKGLQQSNVYVGLFKIFNNLI